MAEGNDNREPVVSTESAPESSLQVGAIPETPETKSWFTWTKVITGVLGALAGLASTQFGAWVGLAALILGLLGFFYLKKVGANFKFESSKTSAGSKTGTEASDNQSRLNQNRDQVDDFLGRERRS